MHKVTVWHKNISNAKFFHSHATWYEYVYCTVRDILFKIGPSLSSKETLCQQIRTFFSHQRYKLMLLYSDIWDFQSHIIKPHTAVFLVMTTCSLVRVCWISEPHNPTISYPDDTATHPTETLVPTYQTTRYHSLPGPNIMYVSSLGFSYMMRVLVFLMAEICSIH